MSEHHAPEREPSKAERTRRRILEAAAHELAAHGYGGTSLRAVAAGAGLRMPSLYFHFASKDDLVAATLADGIDSTIARVTDALGRLPAGADARDRLRASIEEHLAALQSRHDHAAAVIRMAATLPTELRQAQASHERRYVDLWAGLLADAQRAGAIDPTLDPGLLATFVIGGLNSHLDAGTDASRADALAGLASTLLLQPGD